jgi:hypothetical protein
MASKTVYPDLTLVPASMGSEQVANLADVTHTVFRDMQNEAGVKGKNTPAFSGSQAEIKSQLYRGFMDAGRPDLARMVKTKDFDTWISAESGWRTDVVSQYYSGHGRNAGLFQFALLDRDWVWSDVNRSDWSYQATPYQQARAVVANFSLTPSDIKTYAEQIRNGEYGGWG